jgi:hypothetical protein
MDSKWFQEWRHTWTITYQLLPYTSNNKDDFHNCGVDLFVGYIHWNHLKNYFDSSTCITPVGWLDESGGKFTALCLEWAWRAERGWGVSNSMPIVSLISARTQIAGAQLFQSAHSTVRLLTFSLWTGNPLTMPCFLEILQWYRKSPADHLSLKFSWYIWRIKCWNFLNSLWGLGTE